MSRKTQNDVSAEKTISNINAVENNAIEIHEQFRNAIDLMEDPFVILEAVRNSRGEITDFIYRYLNKSAAEENKLEIESTVGCKLSEILPAIHSSSIFQAYCNVTETGVPQRLRSQPYEDEIKGRALKGIFNLNVTKLNDGVAITWRNISRKIKIESNLKKAIDILKEKNKQLEKFSKRLHSEISERKEIEQKMIRAMNELARSNKELEQFAYIASHDLQEPLRMISNFAQLLSRQYKNKLGADADEYINFIINGTRMMQNLVSDLLKFSRISTKAKTFEKTDLNTILETALNNLSINIKETNAQIMKTDLPIVSCDKTQILQLFQNLISNAIKFTKGRTPEIKINCKKEKDDWVFSISDNGVGIEQEYYERIFVIFQRLHTRDEYEGTGIGLAICRKIAEGHNGRIWVRSVPGEGSTFYFTLPAL
ncbi:MAG: sensor histidine kinase [Bacillota bacterium]